MADSDEVRSDPWRADWPSYAQEPMLIVWQVAALSCGIEPDLKVVNGSGVPDDLNMLYERRVKLLARKLHKEPASGLVTYFPDHPYNQSKKGARNRMVDVVSCIDVLVSGNFSPLPQEFIALKESLARLPIPSHKISRADSNITPNEPYASAQTAAVPAKKDQMVRAANRPPAPSSAFINRFAKALDLGSLGVDAYPTIFAVDVAELVEGLFNDAPRLRFTRKIGGTYAELTMPQTKDVLQELGETFRIEGTGTALDIVAIASGVKVGAVTLNKTRIVLKSLSLPMSAGVEIERTSTVLGQDEERLPLAAFLDANNAFILLFNQPSLAYIDGTLFRDEAFTGGGATLLSHLKTEPLLAHVVDEKKPIDPPRVAFDVLSTFGVVVDAVAVNDDFLVCDDLGDEWADFIGINSISTPPSINF